MDPSSVPLLAWHFVAVNNCVNPMLAFCRGDVVHFLLVSCSVMVSAVRPAPPPQICWQFKVMSKKKYLWHCHKSLERECEACLICI